MFVFISKLNHVFLTLHHLNAATLKEDCGVRLSCKLLCCAVCYKCRVAADKFIHMYCGASWHCFLSPRTCILPCKKHHMNMIMLTAFLLELALVVLCNP